MSRRNAVLRRQRRASAPRRKIGLFRTLKIMIVAGLTGVLAIPLGVDALTFIKRYGDDSACKLVRVIDGDTVMLWCPGNGVKRARLAGFDTPEMFSPQCKAELVKATAAMVHLRWIFLNAKDLSIVKQGTDQYGRDLMFMSTDQGTIARQMIDAGHARAYSGGRRADWCA